MATITSADFLELVRKSGLLEPGALEDWLKSHQATLPEYPSEIADKLFHAGLLTRLQAEYLLQGRWKGFIINGKYKLLDLLGSGGMGRVYLCEHIQLRVRVALKMLPASKINDREAVERFYREARAFASLNHPNLVRGHDVDTDSKTHFIVMEYVDGVDLQHLVSRTGPLPAPRACEYIRQAAMGLQHAHERGWIHRDVKPANLLLDRTGLIKVSDMGLARLLSDKADNLTGQLDDNSILGTADYLSPEQSMDSHAVDIRSDIYSLGCTLYFLLTGKAPFGHGTTTQKLVWHQLRAAEPVRKVRPDLPAAVGAAVETMMAKEKEKRFQTPAEVAAVLAPFASPTPIPPSQEELAAGSHEQAAAAQSEGKGPVSAARNSAHDRPTPSPAFTPTQRLATSPPNPQPLPTAHPAPANVATIPATVPTGASSDIDLAKAATSHHHPQSATMTAIGSRLKRPIKRNWAVAAIVLICVGIGAAAWWYIQESPEYDIHIAQTKGTLVLNESEDGKVLFVNSQFAQITVIVRSADGSRERKGTRPAYHTLAEAVANVREGERILIAQPFFSEPLDLDGTQMFRANGAKEDHALPGGVTIEGRGEGRGPGEVTSWVARADRSKPIVSLRSVKGWTIKGFSLDGEGTQEMGVSLKGSCPGLNLTDMQIVRCKRGMVLRNVEGAEGNPVAFTRLAVNLSAAGPGDACIALDAGQSPCAHIIIEGCRIQGAKAGIRVTGPATHLEVRNNRFYKLDEAFQIFPATAGDKQVAPLHVELTSNTFADAKTGLHLAALPPSDKTQKNGLTIRGNLFWKVPGTLVIDQAIDSARAESLFAQSKGNVQDVTSGERGLPFLPMKTMPFQDLSTAEDDASFLRYPADSPLMQAGPGTTPVGVPPR